MSIDTIGSVTFPSGEVRSLTEEEEAFLKSFEVPSSCGPRLIVDGYSIASFVGVLRLEWIKNLESNPASIEGDPMNISFGSPLETQNMWAVRFLLTLSGKLARMQARLSEISLAQFRKAVQGQALPLDDLDN